MASWDDDDCHTFYCDTSVCRAGWNMVNSKSVITFIGGRGCGKSATSRHLALRLKKEMGYEIVPVCKPEQIIEYVNTERKQVFLLDDVLGSICIDMTLYNNIERHKESFDTGLAKLSKILFTCRKTVFKEAMRLNSYITVNSIDFQDEENTLTENDKYKILERHCLNKHIGHEDIKNISLKSTNLMFPLLCKLFSINNKYRSHGEKFFNQPIDCLLDEINKLQAASKTQYTALVLCLVNENAIRLDKLLPQEIKTDVYNNCGLNLGTSDREIWNALEELTETYITKLDNTYKFIHDSIYEVVAYHYGRKYPDQMIEYMPSNFIMNKIKVLKQQTPEEYLSIILDTDMYPKLAKRLYKDIQSLELYDVFMNPALKHHPFLTEFIKLLKSKSYSHINELFLLKQKKYSYVLKKSQSVVDNDSDTSRSGIWNGIRRQHLLLNIINDDDDDCWQDEDEELFVCDIRIISWVVYYGHTEILKYIIDNAVKNYTPSDVFGGESEQSRLLTIGCFSNTCSIVELLLNYVSNNCINKCCINDPRDSEFDANIHRLCSPVDAACHVGNMDIIKLLLRKGANVWYNDGGLIPLLSAIRQEHFEIVKYIVTDPNIESSNEIMKHLLCLAAAIGHVDLVDLFVQLGVEINTCLRRKSYEVICASFDGQYVKYQCHDEGVIINDEYNSTPLLAAVTKSHTKIVKFLIGKGADVDLCDVEGSSPLIEASRHGYLDIIKLLVHNGANVNSQNFKGELPLIHVVKSGHFEITELLLENGADVSLVDRHSLGPFSYAAQQGRYDLVECLIKHSGNNKEIEDLGMSMKIAMWDGHTTILHQLVEMENKKNNLSGNHHLFDMILDLKKDIISCGCVMCIHLSLPNLQYCSCLPYEFLKYRTLLTFIKLSTTNDFLRILNLGLNPNSSVKKCHVNNDRCMDSQRSVLHILTANNSWITDREKKLAILLEHKVKTKANCKTREIYHSNMIGDAYDYAYISQIEYAHLQGSGNYQALFQTLKQISPFHYCFDIKMDYDDEAIYSQVLKYFRRKSFSARSEIHLQSNHRAQAKVRRYTF